MSHERQQSRKQKWVRALMRGLLVFVVVAAFGYFAYRVYASRTSGWPETRDCTVIGSRAVRTMVGGFRYPLIAWEGEYHLQYTVDGKQYFLWTPGSAIDPDKAIVEHKLSDLPLDCRFRVQYNPRDPSESVAYLERR